MALWDPPDLPPGATVTDGADVTVVGNAIRPPTVAWWIGSDGEDPAPWGPDLARGIEAVVRCDGALALRSRGEAEAVLVGQSEAHLDLALDRIWQRTGVRLHATLPPVDYREALVTEVRDVEAIHQATGPSGLVSEYGRCVLSLRPLEAPSGSAAPVATPCFVDGGEVDEEDLPPRFRPAIGAGALAALQRGPTAGYPVVGVEVRLTGGDYDILQSTDQHFHAAGDKAARAALQRAGTVILEPWCDIEVDAPHGVLGSVISDIAAHRGRIVGMVVSGATAHLQARCPYRELRGFPSRLEDLSAGRGRLRVTSTSPSYAPLPADLVPEAIETSRYRR